MAIGFGIWGINWGLPSSERRDLFLKPEQQLDRFFSDISEARQSRYQQIGNQPVAYAGRLIREGEPFIPPSNILLCYSSYLLRSHDGDEQNAPVMLSRINPFKLKFYPQTYQYGGAYIYPLAVFVGIHHVLKLITLIPETTFYYKYPNKMADIFLAIRLWSLIGLCFAVFCLFWLSNELFGKSIALWTSAIYALTPANIAFSKIGKPHIWASSWVFLALYFLIKGEKTNGTKNFILAGIFYGFALGSATSQWVFAPLFFWACWSSSIMSTFKKITITFVLASLTFIIVNPTLLWHLQDYLDELRFLSTWYPFKVRFASVPDFYIYLLAVGTGIPVMVIGSIGMIYIFISKKFGRFYPCLAVFIFCTVLASFQVQALSKDSVHIRLFIAFLGGVSLLAVWYTFQVRWGKHLRWTCFLFMVAQGAIYNLHFSSDAVPHDNTSRASIWIANNIPKDVIIEQMASIPNVDHFPPIHFDEYNISQFPYEGPVVGKDIYLILNPRFLSQEDIVRMKNYKLHKQFNSSPIQKLGFSDRLTNANFPIFIYKRIL